MLDVLPIHCLIYSLIYGISSCTNVFNIKQTKQEFQKPHTRDDCMALQWIRKETANTFTLIASKKWDNLGGDFFSVLVVSKFSRS